MLVKQTIQVAAVLVFVAGALAWLISPWLARAQNPPTGGAAASWRPGKDAKFTGPEACAKCHLEESARQQKSAMGRALEPAAQSEILRAYPRLTFRSGKYTFSLTRQGEQSIYAVTDGDKTFAAPVLYSFGQGKAGQTYVFQYNGSFYESRLSFYQEIKNLDWTIGYPREVPAEATLDAAAGRAISDDEARSCFSCHATGASNNTKLRLDKLIPGVTCEACHGPGGEHLAAIKAEKFADTRVFNPGKMSADEMSQEFCGSCHRSAEQVSSSAALRGPISVRFQPYRLFLSRGHDPFDARLSCTACHNPHGDQAQEIVFYDAKCFACHRSAESLKAPAQAAAETAKGRVDKACPVGAKLCVSCHMPKVALPNAHFQFTDHRIQIVKPN